MVEFIKLGSLVDIRTGKLNANAANENGCYPFFTCSVEPLTINTYAYDCESVLIAGNGDLNVKYYNGKFNAYQRTYIIESKDKDILSVRFLYYFLCEYIDTLRNNSIGGVIKYIKLSDLTDINFPLIPIKEQQRIVKILDKAEEISIKKKLANEKLDEFLKSTFIDMFGDPVTNPNNYQFVCLGDLTTEICDIGSNGSNAVVAKNLKMSDTEDYAYMIRAVNFSDNNIFENMKYVSKEVYDFFRKSQIFGNEIIMCKIGSAGKFWLMPKLNKPTSLGLNSFLMRFNDNTNRIFIYHYLNTSYGQIEINTRVSGAVTKSITKGAIRTIPVYLPDIKQQNQFAQIVQKAEAQKKKNQKVIEQMDNLFNSLMQQAFNSSL